MIVDGHDAIPFTSMLHDEEVEQIHAILAKAAARVKGVYPDIAATRELYVGYYAD